jgi:hypothetical protein
MKTMLTGVHLANAVKVCPCLLIIVVGREDLDSPARQEVLERCHLFFVNLSVGAGREICVGELGVAAEEDGFGI